jgi:glyoxylase-like metal-dependent hydrolase (beta-lactamase superfamily II)
MVQAQPADFMNSYDTEKIGDGLYTFRYGPYRNIFLVSEAGVIATDPLNARAARALRTEIARLTDHPVKYVAYSHSHWDHVPGGQVFKAEGAEFVAQEECLENLRLWPNPEVVPPDITFTDRYKISLGDSELELFHFGPSHDTCLSVMIARPANVLFVVDIVNPPSGWHLEWNPTLPDTHIYNLVPYLEAVETLVAKEGVETIVGGHIALGRDGNGRPFVQPATGPVTAITERRLFWQTIIGAVEQEIQKGTYAEFVAARLDRSELDAKLGRYNKDDMSIMLRRLASYVISGR